MDFDTFAQLLRDRLPQGLELNNPGAGTSTVMWCDDDRICYRRGKLRLYIGIRDLYEAYLRFSGCELSSRQLKDYAPLLYDSRRNGHNCHCTFFFLALRQMGIVAEIWGTGRAGNPFGVTLPAIQATA